METNLSEDMVEVLVALRDLLDNSRIAFPRTPFWYAKKHAAEVLEKYEPKEENKDGSL